MQTSGTNWFKAQKRDKNLFPKILPLRPTTSHPTPAAGKNAEERLARSAKPKDMIWAAGKELDTLENLTPACKSACMLATEGVVYPQLLILAPKL